MPVIDIYSPLPAPPAGLLPALAGQVSDILDLPDDRVWLLWHAVPDGNHFRPNWSGDPARAGPIVKVRCKSDYSDLQVRTLIGGLAESISRRLDVPVDSVYIVVDPVVAGRLFVRGTLWE
jgi:phenylpyruvate tautomerase PptA (4-oxalocrotonate tautomerase family)